MIPPSARVVLHTGAAFTARLVVALVAAVAVLLLPSTAWSVEEPSDPPTTELTEPPAPTATVTETATTTVTQTVVEQGEAVCGSGDLPACEVSMPVDDQAAFLLAAGLTVALLGALLVTSWGNSGD